MTIMCELLDSSHLTFSHWFAWTRQQHKYMVEHGHTVSTSTIHVPNRKFPWFWVRCGVLFFCISFTCVLSKSNIHISCK